MKILYVYPKNDDMVMQHVTMLSEGMPEEMVQEWYSHHKDN